MAGEVYAAMNEAGRLGWRPSQDHVRQAQHIDQRRRERAERARQLVKRRA